MDTKMKNEGPIIAPLIIEGEEKCMAMISGHKVHFFDNSGKNISIENLNIDKNLHILIFINSDKRSFILAQSGVEYNDGFCFIVNKDNEVIKSFIIESTLLYCNIADNSIIMGMSEIIPNSGILHPEKLDGKLIMDGESKDKIFMGKIGEYLIFLDDSNTYSLYAIDTDWELDGNGNKVYFCDLVHIDDFNVENIILWETKGGVVTDCTMNVIYHRNDTDTMCLNSYSTHYDHCVEKFQFPIEVDINNIDWQNDIQYLYDSQTIILHHHNINSQWTGFTMIIEHDCHSQPHFKLLNQKRLGKYYNDYINKYKNSMILMEDHYESVLYSKSGEVISKIKKEGTKMSDIYESKYLIVNGSFSSPISQNPFFVNTYRFGILEKESLQLIVPLYYTNIEYFVWQETSYEWGDNGSPIVFFKVSMECLSESETPIKCWGLFKHDRMVLPCFFRKIEIFNINNHNFLLIENLAGKQGLFKDEEIIIPCDYKSIYQLGNYIILEKDNKNKKVYYFYTDHILSDTFISIEEASYLPNRTNKIINNVDTLIVRNEQGNYGIIDHGFLVVDCIYDEVKVERILNISYSFEPRLGLTHPIWLTYHVGSQIGIYSNHDSDNGFVKGINSGPIFNNVVIKNLGDLSCNIKFENSRNLIFEIDGSLYSPDDITHPLVDDHEFVLKGLISSTILVFSKIDSMEVKFINFLGKEIDYKILDAELNYIDDNDLDWKSKANYAVCNTCPCQVHRSLIRDEECFFSFKDNAIVKNPLLEDNNCDEDEEEDEEDSTDYEDMGYEPEDKYDYDRDTYYALGGDDYEAFKERGGSIDDMMDGLGL